MISENRENATYRTSWGGYFSTVVGLIVCCALSAPSVLLLRIQPDLWIVPLFCAGLVLLCVYNLLLAATTRVSLDGDFLRIDSIFAKQQIPYQQIRRVELYGGRTEIVINMENRKWTAFELATLRNEDDLLKRLREALPDVEFADDLISATTIARLLKEKAGRLAWILAGIWAITIPFVEPEKAPSGVLVGIAWRLYKANFRKRMTDRFPRLTWWLEILAVVFLIDLIVDTKGGNLSWEVINALSGFGAVYAAKVPFRRRKHGTAD